MNRFFNSKVFLIFFVLMAIQSFRGVKAGSYEMPITTVFLNLTTVPLFFSFIYAFFFTKRPRQVGKKGYTRLMELCYLAKIDEIKKIDIESLKTDINRQDDKGYSALICAVSGGSIEVVKYLIEHGADKTLTSKAGNDALHFAVKNKQHDIVSILEQK